MYPVMYPFWLGTFHVWYIYICFIGILMVINPPFFVHGIIFHDGPRQGRSWTSSQEDAPGYHLHLRALQARREEDGSLVAYFSTTVALGDPLGDVGRCWEIRWEILRTGRYLLEKIYFYGGCLEIKDVYWEYLMEYWWLGDMYELDELLGTSVGFVGMFVDKRDEKRIFDHHCVRSIAILVNHLGLDKQNDTDGGGRFWRLGLVVSNRKILIFYLRQILMLVIVECTILFTGVYFYHTFFALSKSNSCKPAANGRTHTITYLYTDFKMELVAISDNPIPLLLNNTQKACFSRGFIRIWDH